jgi:hypothetical protein
MKVKVGSREMQMEPAASIERCTSERCAGGCEAPNVRFYVSIWDHSGGRVGFLLGPFETHQAALDAVPEGKRKAEEVDARAFWHAFGTLRVEGPPWPKGVLEPKEEVAA